LCLTIELLFCTFMSDCHCGPPSGL
jgi:hypothetical protein